MSGNNIKVVCRFRPQNKLEIREGGVPIIEISEDGTGVALKGKDTNSFSFDKCFGLDTKQADVFGYSIRSIVDDVVSGYNGTVFAYGQTGSGKTYTMMGSNIDDADNKGVIPRIVEQIFENIQLASSSMEFTVKVAYMEIYMEKVKDLLVPVNDNLAIHEDKLKGVYVKGLKEVYVANADEVYDVMRVGGDNRVVASTNMNAESSRSHSIVLVTITQKNLDTGAAKSGKLYLVDLAGSEKVGKTGASGQTLEEAKKINKSLTALGMVINSLTDGKSSHVPYRDSKLTRILQESLGGNSRTTLIINCSPSSYNEAETISTLRFGARAKTIKNKAKVNADLSPAELKALLKRVKTDAVSFRAYISALENEIGQWRQGKKVPEPQWASADANKKQMGIPTPPPTPLPIKLEDDSRPSTPATALGKDEKDEFLKREQELLEQIAERKLELINREKQMEESQEMLNELKEREKVSIHIGKQLSTDLNQARVQLENDLYNKKELDINLDVLRSENVGYLTELKELKAALSQLQDEQQKNQESLLEAQTVAVSTHTHTHTHTHSHNRQIQEKIESHLSLQDLRPEDIRTLKQELETAQEAIRQHTTTIDQLVQERDLLANKRDDLEGSIRLLQLDYEELLDKTTTMESETDGETAEDLEKTITNLRLALESQYENKHEIQEREIQSLRLDLDLKTKEEDRLAGIIQDLEAERDKLLQKQQGPTVQSKEALEQKEKDVERLRKTMSQDLAEFETMRRVFMRDLQSRCEKVVELEMTLEETKSQQNNLLKATSNKPQIKMADLEKGIAELSNVQKQ
ncbi:P-loop containing nucleoside triphosphate hydrolase protein, partial [Sporodiniella umbellata]